MPAVAARRQYSTSGPRQRDDSRDQRPSAGHRHRDDEQRRPAAHNRSDDSYDQRPKRKNTEQIKPREAREARESVAAPKPRKQEFVTVNTGYGTQEPIEKSQFLEGLNTLKLSSNVINICKQVNVTDIHLTDMAHDSFNNTYYYLFNSKIFDYDMTWEAGVLKAYDIQPYIKMSEELINDIATMKWNIYCAYKANNITETIVKFIGIVAGICSYFEKIDMANANAKNYAKLKSDHTYYDIKLL